VVYDDEGIMRSQPAFAPGGPPSEALLIKPEVLRQELAGLELLVLQGNPRAGSADKAASRTCHSVSMRIHS
jgi:hypothetical protein